MHEKLNFDFDSVKRYVRKGVPNEHRALIWMAASGAQDQLEKNPGYYQSLLEAQHDPKLMETIKTGFFLISFTVKSTDKPQTHHRTESRQMLLILGKVIFIILQQVNT